MFGRLKALIIKELLSILRDPKSRVILIVPPLIQLLIFSFAATQEVINISAVVLDRDMGRWSYELTERFRASPTFTEVRTVDSPAELQAAIDRQQAIMAIHISQDFSRRVEAGRGAQVQLILDGRRSNAAQIVAGYSTRIVDRLNQDIAFEQGRDPASSTIVARNWFNPNLDFQWYTVPSLIGLLITVTGIIVTGLSVARERELATFDQLLVSPLTPAEILVGKTMPALMIGLVQASLLITVAILVFRVPFTGSLLLLYGSIAVFLASVIGVGLFISALSQTQQQAILGAFTFTAPAILLSGFATPIENMPEWLQVVTNADPLRHFLVVVKGVFVKGMTADLVFANTWPMAVIALFTLTGAAWLFRRRLS